MRRRLALLPTMCGIAGCLDLSGNNRDETELVGRMLALLVHRGPDSSGLAREGGLTLGFRRLKILDPAFSEQPFRSDDGRLLVACNGEIFNYRALRAACAERYPFVSRGDVEVLLPLYRERGVSFLKLLNGQFALALYDRAEGRLLLARDPFGICPLYYTIKDGLLLFASEIKALFAHSGVERRLDLTGLDQVLCFPGPLSPRTLFRGVQAVESGTVLTVHNGSITRAVFHDLEYPDRESPLPERDEAEYVEELRELLDRSIGLRLQADVPVGFYLSGGLDSTLLATRAARRNGEARPSFSITFPDRPEMTERSFQRLAAETAGTRHQEIAFSEADINDALRQAVYHAECPTRETYNTCSLALSRAARGGAVPVVLSGEGADEFFAGYPGYRFDHRAAHAGDGLLADELEREARLRLFGDSSIVYEKNYHEWGENRQALFAPDVAARLSDFDCLRGPPVDPAMLRGRHPLHQRSYLDFKLRLVDHLVADHGDRMAMANSVEARYPFLDPDIMAFATRLPPHWKLRGLSEKYILKEAARASVPDAIIAREKFGFHAQGSDFLLQRGAPLALEYLSDAVVRKYGVFDPDVIRRLRAAHLADGFRLNLPYEDDLLLIVLTTHLLMDVFACSI